MCNECFSHMSKTLQKDISVSHMTQNSAGKNKFASQHACLWPHFSVKYYIDII